MKFKKLSSIFACGLMIIGSTNFAFAIAPEQCTNHVYSVDNIIKAKGGYLGNEVTNKVTPSPKLVETCSMCGYERTIELKPISRIRAYNNTRTTYTYSGNQMKPGIYSLLTSDNQLVNKNDWSVKYEGSLVEPGRATATISYDNDVYQGKYVFTYYIVPKYVKMTSLTSTKNSLTVVTEKTRDNCGYEIKYSTNKDMSNANVIVVEDGKNNCTTINKLKSNTKYYIQVRTFVEIDDSTVKYSPWSGIGTRFTKK